jgi:hypothetical protein
MFIPRGQQLGLGRKPSDTIGCPQQALETLNRILDGMGYYE